MGQRLGQHFLHQRSFLERIARAACPTRERLVIEIGPGRGSLTEALLARAARVVAIELDAELAGELRRRFEGAPLEVVGGDVLDIDLGQWGPAALAGNLPYYITSPILTKIFALSPALLRRAVVLLQKEVADRLSAGPGGRDYGYLTVQARVFTEATTLFRVPPGAFSPPPKVDSAAVLLEPRTPAVPDAAAFLEFVSRCFRQKRKTLRNNLAQYYGEQVGSWPEGKLRAEQLSMEELIGLYERVRRS